MLCPHIIQTASNCGTESYWGSYKPAESCRFESTNSRKKKHSFLSRNSRH
jgi:hypothetical protein